MKSRLTKILTMSTFLFFTEAAMASETPYHYDAAQNKCVNSQGLSGLRPNYRGTCGDLWGQDLKDASFEKKSLAGANLSRANLKGADLRGVDLRGSWMLMTNVDGAKMDGAKFNERTILPFSRKDAEKRGMIYEPTSEYAKLKELKSTASVSTTRAPLKRNRSRN